MIFNTDFAIHTSMMLRPHLLRPNNEPATNNGKSTAQRANQTVPSFPSVPVFDFYSYVPKRLSDSMEHRVESLQKFVEECLRWIDELEQLVQIDANTRSRDSFKAQRLPIVQYQMLQFQFQPPQQRLQLPQMQAPIQVLQPQLFLYTKDRVPAGWSTKFEDLHQESQNALFKIRERLREYLDKAKKLEQCTRLYDSCVSKNNLEEGAARIVQVEKLHQYMVLVRTAYLIEQCRRGDDINPSLEVNHREVAHLEAIARRFHPTLHLPKTQNLPHHESTQNPATMLQLAPAGFPTPTPASSSGGLFSKPSGSASSSALLEPSAELTPLSTPSGSTSGSLFRSTPAPSGFGSTTPGLASNLPSALDLHSLPPPRPPASATPIWHTIKI